MRDDCMQGTVPKLQVILGGEGGSTIYDVLKGKTVNLEAFKEYLARDPRDTHDSGRTDTTRKTPEEILNECFMPVRDFLQKTYSPRAVYMHPWLKSGSLVMLYAGKSVGKTFFTYAIVIAMNYGRSIHRWEGKTPVKCMYMDGEMHVLEVQKRLRQMLPSGDDDPFTIISSMDITEKGYEKPDLTKAEWREAVTDLLRNHREHKFLILDNLVSLCPGIDTSNEVEWTPINQWLLQLRAMDVAVLLVHHATKKNDSQRGTGHRVDNLDAVMVLKRPVGYKKSQGARFVVSFETSRDLYGSDLDDFIFQMKPDPDNPGMLTWKTEPVGGKKESGSKGNAKTGAIIIALSQGGKQIDVAKQCDCSAQHVSNVKKKAIADGLMDADSHLTDKGRELFKAGLDGDLTGCCKSINQSNSSFR